MNCKSLDLNFGTPLKLEVAEKMLDRHKKILKSELTIQSKTSDAEEHEKTLRDSNAFIFDKEVFEGILDKGADFIVLALGAHLNDQNISINKESKTFKKGSFTVMVAGYKGKCDGTKLIELNLVDEDSIYEYPPGTFIGDFKDPLRVKK